MKLTIITGQTATGKTKLAEKYAKKYNGELINCDSRQIYKYLDIVTGKDIPQNSKFKNQSFGYYLISTNSNQFQPTSIKLWLYDIVDPKEYFSSFDYVWRAKKVIKDILKRGKTPIIVGGTYLYLKHLLYGVKTENIPPDWGMRKKLSNKSISELQNMLKKISVQSINQLNNSELNNPQRLIRKIEIAKAGSKNSQSLPAGRQGVIRNSLINNYNVEIIGLKFKDNEMLHQRIKQRVENRLNAGAVEEVKKLLKKGYTEQDPGLKTIGYQQIIKYLKGGITKEEAIKQWINKEMQYAKRQYTFMKKASSIVWRTV